MAVICAAVQLILALLFVVFDEKSPKSIGSESWARIRAQQLEPPVLEAGVEARGGIIRLIFILKKEVVF